MLNDDRFLCVRLTARLNADIPAQVTLSYDPRDPYAVRLAVYTDGVPAGGATWVEWLLARDLLADGLITYSGEGDVRVWPDEVNAAVWVELSSPTGQCHLVFDRAEIEKLMERTENLVAPGSESLFVDWDREWARLARTPGRPEGGGVG